MRYKQAPSRVYFLCPAFYFCTGKAGVLMENALFNLAAGNGIWAALYVFLFLYVLYDSRNREKKYQATIEENQNIIKELSQKFGIVEDIQKDVIDIKEDLKRRKDESIWQR